MDVTVDCAMVHVKIGSRRMNDDEIEKFLKLIWEKQVQRILKYPVTIFICKKMVWNVGIC